MDDYDIDFFVMKKDEMHFDYIENYPCQDIDEILNYKIERNLEKDKISVAKILDYKKTHIN